MVIEAEVVLRVLLVFVRVGGLLVAAPFFSRAFIPVLVKVMLAVVLAFVLAGFARGPLPAYVNHPVGFTYSTQSQGDDTIDLMKTINDVPNNAGTGVWPWAGTRVFGAGQGDSGTLRASFRAWNDAFATNVIEDQVVVVARVGQPARLPATVRSLDLSTGDVTDVAVEWQPLPELSKTGTYTVQGVAQVQAPKSGRGIPMTAVTAFVDVRELAGRVGP